MLTIFSCPKPFRDSHIAVIQRNAIISWTRLRPAPQIILIGDEAGVGEFAREVGAIWIPEVACSDFGTPLLPDIFAKAHAAATEPILAYVNADIILLDDFLDALRAITRARFLVVGYRTDTDITEPIDFTDEAWRPKLVARVHDRGVRHSHTGCDYFVFKPGLYDHVPSFALGRTTYDNWLIWKARADDVPVIDATAMVTCIHQDHGYSYSLVGQTQTGPIDNVVHGVESERNRSLILGWRQGYTLRDANWLLTPSGMVPARRPEHLRRRLTLLLPGDTYPIVRSAAGRIVRGMRCLPWASAQMLGGGEKRHSNGR